MSRDVPLSLRTIVVVVAIWGIAGVLLASHTALAANLQGAPLPLASVVGTALINSVPWIPVTLIVVWLTVRFPMTRSAWRRSIWVHGPALLVLAFAANVLVVLGFWISSGSFQDLGTLARSGLFWATMRIHISALLYASIVAVTQWVQHYRVSQTRALNIARLEGQLAQARLTALNAQLRPHFLFNTLHTIGHLWRSGRAEEADRLLDHLGALFQRVQSVTSVAEVALASEMAMIDDYLAIERARFPDRLRVNVSVSGEALDCLVPPLLLQPLVENAIRHGISKTSSAGQIDVEADVAEGRLHVLVLDDGPGEAGAGSSEGNGTGLRNAKERIAELYGSSGRFESGNRDQGGFRVAITIPARPDPGEVSSDRAGGGP